MKNRGAKTSLIILILLCLTPGISGISIGTAPGIMDLGELTPGKDYAFAFYLTTNSKTDIFVTLDYIRPHADIYTINQSGRYTFRPDEASQEDVSRWVEIPRDTLLLSPTNVKVVPLSTGGVVKSYGTVNVVLHVPTNADPGYHAGAIALNPDAPSVGEAGGTGVATFGLTRFIFVFRVAGTAVRKGQIMTVFGTRMDAEKARINVLFKNTGTCTFEAKIDYVKLYDKYGNLVANLIGAENRLIKPNEIATLNAYWTGKNVTGGSYRAEVRVCYVTGCATFEDKVEISDIINIEPKPLLPNVEVSGIPWMTILLILIIIILLYYYYRGED